jgi:cupin fold WbuC family metalloprotein
MKIQRIERILQKHIDDLFNPNIKDIRRICLHNDDSDLLHVMLISIPPNSSYPIHIHKSKKEFYFLIKGYFEVHYHDTDLIIKETVIMSDSSTVSTAVEIGIAHSVSSNLLGALFLEITTGPFIKEDTIILSP